MRIPSFIFRRWWFGKYNNIFSCIFKKTGFRNLSGAPTWAGCTFWATKGKCTVHDSKTSFSWRIGPDLVKVHFVCFQDGRIKSIQLSNSRYMSFQNAPCPAFLTFYQEKGESWDRTSFEILSCANLNLTKLWFACSPRFQKPSRLIW